MKSFILSAIAASIASAEYRTLKVEIDGYESDKYYEPRPFSRAIDLYRNKGVSMANNDAFNLLDATGRNDASYMPNLVGGSIEYDVDVSSIDCGCVAGLYLADIKSAGCQME